MSVNALTEPAGETPTFHDGDTHIVTAALDGVENAAAPTLDLRVSIPAATAYALKHATHGKLSLDEAASMVLQLYASAPLDRDARVITSQQFASIAETLGHSPQTVEAMVAAIRDMGRISVAGVRLELTKEDIDIMHARNTLGLPAKEYLKSLWREMFDAWRNGRI